MAHNASQPQDVTLQLADYAASATLRSVPENVRKDARRIFFNILGCSIGGSVHETVAIVRDALREFSGPEQATLIGLREKGNILHAAYINCLSSSVDSFDDSHADAIVHPCGPVASVLLALSERQRMSGADFLLAFILGVETICRIAKAITTPPAKGNLAWVVTPIVGGIGAAVAAGKVLGLDAKQIAWAMGIAGSQAAGYRANHGTMNMPLMPAQSARSGLEAALLAAKGVSSSQRTLEAKYGFCEVFSLSPNTAAISEGLGDTYSLLGTRAKPYPCGVVVNPILDATLRLRGGHTIRPDEIAGIDVFACPTAVALANRQHPADPLAAQVSIQHWVAVALAGGGTTTGELSQARIADGTITALRNRVTVFEDAAQSEDAARVEVTLKSGERLVQIVEHCLGSAARPMTDEELTAKFRVLSAGIKTDAEVDTMVRYCQRIEELDDVAVIVRVAA